MELCCLCNFFIDGRVCCWCCLRVKNFRLRRVKITIKTGREGKAKVRLYFSEPEERAKKGSRVFGVNLQGREALSDVDLVKDFGNQAVTVKEFPVELKEGGKLKIVLSSKKGKTALAGVEVIWQ